MFGCLVWVFQDDHLSGSLGFTPTGSIEPSIPVLMFCVAYGLSMDYEVILALSFLSYVGSGVVFLKELGLGTALTVLVDATLIRLVLLPLAMRLAGRANWWAPRRLRRLRIREAHAPADGLAAEREFLALLGEKDATRLVKALRTLIRPADRS
ncbi:hypothetical protein [Streptomyces griseosporeus]|uniref:hypothetical protein n=1 Tax=Streptomyces griseosporeus TaxID=1910 RepID=UPI0036909711